MPNRTGSGLESRRFVFAAVLVAGFIISPIQATPSAVSGRLTDVSGAALPGATILVFPAAAHDEPPSCSQAITPGTGPSDPQTAEGAPETCALLRTDLDGGFVVLLPPGRYKVAAIKTGYEVSITEVHSLASRVVRLRLRPTVTEAARARRGPASAIERLLHDESDDILRSAGAALATPYTVAAGAADSGSDAGTGGADGPGTLLGSIDGDVTQSLTAAGLPGLSSSPVGDLGRTTTLVVQAPVDDRLALNVTAGS